jgi:hypothetical protein
MTYHRFGILHGGDNIKKDIDINYIKILKSIGIFLIFFVSTILWISTKYVIINPNYLSVISIPVSVGIALFAIALSIESDIRMKTLAEDTFLSVAGLLEDRRLSLKNKRLQLQYLIDKNYQNILLFQLIKIDYWNSLSFSIWKCYTDLQRVDKFRKYMKKGKHLEDKQVKIIKYLKLYYEELITGRNLLKMQIDNEYKNHIKKMFEIIEKFEIYPVSKYDIVYNLMIELRK